MLLTGRDGCPAPKIFLRGKIVAAKPNERRGEIPHTENEAEKIHKTTYKNARL